MVLGQLEVESSAAIYLGFLHICRLLASYRAVHKLPSTAQGQAPLKKLMDEMSRRLQESRKALTKDSLYLSKMTLI
jgi:hypothetical protein